MSNQRQTAWQVSLLSEQQGQGTYRIMFVVPAEIAAGQVQIVSQTFDEVVFAPEGPINTRHYFDAVLPYAYDQYTIRWTPLAGPNRGTRMERGLPLPPVGRA